MLKWAIIFFIISVVAGFFGFTGVASGARTIAKVLFFIAIVIFLIILIFGVFMGVLVFQSLIPSWSATKLGQSFYVHASQGFYLGTLANRITSTLLRRLGAGNLITSNQSAAH